MEAVLISFGAHAMALEDKLRSRMKNIKHKLMVMSGKGGVGKSTIATLIALKFAMKGWKVGIMDADLHGPSVPKLLGVEDSYMYKEQYGLTPVIGPFGIKVVSIYFLLSNRRSPIIWRGPLKSAFIRQILAEVAWGALDLLVIDLPPGTGDEPLTIAQTVKDIDGSVVVTIPSKVSRIVVERAIEFSRALKVPIIGIVENMYEVICPVCGHRFKIFKGEAASEIAELLRVKVLGRIPFDPELSEACDKGALAQYLGRDTIVRREVELISKAIEDYLRGIEH
ncbi:MAG: ATP-binding protein [Thermoprotei archaeon]|nr:MAG: ATP-binding protein [Thermoprotei archaeon]RLF25622.1 MAG: ATP-binding protein [Thermoprotei archaeon]